MNSDLSTRARADADALITAALAAVDPATAVRQHLHQDGRLLHIAGETLDLTQGRLFLVSVGKAALPMASAAAGLLAADLHAGIVVTKRGSSGETALSLPPSLQIFHAAHPVSDETSTAAAEAVLALLAQAAAGDLALFLISGGASALLTQPRIPLPGWQQLNAALLASGCTIRDFNTVRRALDRVKGGGLAAAAAPARVVSLILSDVIGNPLPDIGSGPTVPGSASAAAARAVLARTGVAQQLETAVWQQIDQALNQPLATAGDAGVQNVIVGDVRRAAQAAVAAAEARGFQARLLTARLEGEAREAGRFVAALAHDAARGACYVLGGETTVTLRGSGVGGRNLETALAAAVALEGVSQTAVVCFATDGDDGPSGAAGAVVTGETVGNGRVHGLDPLTALANNDSYTYFHQLDRHLPDDRKHLIHTGLTGTNVNDLIFILKY